MNDHDKSNLQYIMSLSEEEFDVWYDKLTMDDVEYALEIMKQARTELHMQEQELLDDVDDTEQAMAVLRGIMAK